MRYKFENGKVLFKGDYVDLQCDMNGEVGVSYDVDEVMAGVFNSLGDGAMQCVQNCYNAISKASKNKLIF